MMILTFRMMGLWPRFRRIRLVKVKGVGRRRRVVKRVIRGVSAAVIK